MVFFVSVGFVELDKGGIDTRTYLDKPVVTFCCVIVGLAGHFGNDCNDCCFFNDSDSFLCFGIACGAANGCGDDEAFE